MTIPFERARAVMQTQKFLIELAYSESTPGVPERIRKQAAALLRHYPTLSDIKLIEIRLERRCTNPMSFYY